MDAKLKALKVADLKAVLAAAAVHIPAKATKPDLIARIIASKPALAAYNALYPPDDLLAPPEEVDWSVEQPEPISEPAPVVTPASPPKPVAPAPAPVADSDPAPAPTTIETPAATTTANTTLAPELDPELEKRRQRAARFGVPFVEPKPEPQPRKKAGKPTRAPSPVKTSVGVDPKKLEERAARFGLKAEQPAVDATDPAPKSRKRAAPAAQELDPEELERRKKRAERFGVPTKP